MMIDEGKPWQWESMTEAQAKDVIAQLKPHLPGSGWKARANSHLRASDSEEIWSVSMWRGHAEGCSTARADIHVDAWIRRIHESADEQIYQPALF